MKQKSYPKTERFKPEPITITEKLDGSNIGFFKCNEKLVIAQRSNIFIYPDEKDILSYKGLPEWLEVNYDELLNSLQEGSGFFGEWISMGKLKYEDFDKKIYMFAKANIKMDEWDRYDVYNIYYNHDLFEYPFVNQTIPEFIGIVPVVKITDDIIDLNYLNSLYKSYAVEKAHRNVEGFVIIYNKNTIRKYVRMKSGKLEDHFWRK